MQKNLAVLIQNFTESKLLYNRVEWKLKVKKQQISFLAIYTKLINSAIFFIAAAEIELELQYWRFVIKVCFNKSAVCYTLAHSAYTPKWIQISIQKKIFFKYNTNMI